MPIVGPLNTGVATGCLTSTANADSNHPVRGNIVGVYVKPVVSCASAPTITIATSAEPVVPILTVATETAGWYYPRTPLHDPTSGAVIANLKSEGIQVDDFVNVEISDAEDGDYAEVWLMLE